MMAIENILRGYRFLSTLLFLLSDSALLFLDIDQRLKMTYFLLIKQVPGSLNQSLPF